MPRSVVIFSDPSTGISHKYEGVALEHLQSAPLSAFEFSTLAVSYAYAKTVSEDIGKKLGVHEIAAELLPEDKLDIVGRLPNERNNVAMVGDAVNDAPALMKATVGIAMGSGTDVARESANVVLIGNDLSKLVETLSIARRCHRTIIQNFVATLVVDSIGVGLAAFGFLNPLLAAFIHVCSDMAFIFNSARLLPPVSSAKKLARGLF
jgi:Cu+-exporting ATPase